jgi:transitional endoplasmic reticulum ATPase
LSPDAQEHKRKPNRLVVDEAHGNDDPTIVAINTQGMNELNIFKGDPVLLKGKRKKETVCVAIPDDGCPVGTIRMNKVVRTNLCCHNGDVITLLPCGEAKFGKHVLVLPFEDSIEGLTGNLFEVYLKPYFTEAYRPVHEGLLNLYIFGVIY